MDERPQYVPEFILKYATLDSAYILAAIFLVAYIIQARNILDVIYFGLVTFYYIRIKIHRWKVGR